LRKALCLSVLVLVTLPHSAVGREPPPATLQAAFETAVPEAGYDRYLHLETGRVYTGGLIIGPTWDEDATTFMDSELGLDVMIEGNGAILDMQGQMICISFCDNRLDIQDCIIVAGQVRFRGDNTPEIDRVPVTGLRSPRQAQSWPRTWALSSPQGPGSRRATSFRRMSLARL